MLFARDRYDYSIPYLELINRNHRFEFFKSIKYYFSLTLNPSNQKKYIEGIVNLYGNIIVFVPMGFFLTILFKKFKKWYVFYPAVILLITFLETTQLLTLRGVMDVDDIVLNLFGASIGRIISLICIHFQDKNH